MNKCVNEVKLSFCAVSENEAFARACVSAFICPADPFVSELAEIKTAVSEAVTNCIVHGYRNVKNGTIFMTLRLFSDRRLYIKIRDKGCGIKNIEQALEPLFTTAPEEERAGLGFAVMESFTDSMRVKSAPSRGTTVVMEKILQEKTDNENFGIKRRSGSIKGNKGNSAGESGEKSGISASVCEQVQGQRN